MSKLIIYRSIYDAKRPYHPNMMPAQDITHLIYSFGNVKPDGMMYVIHFVSIGYTADRNTESLTRILHLAPHGAQGASKN